MHDSKERLSVEWSWSRRDPTATHPMRGPTSARNGSRPFFTVLQVGGATGPRDPVIATILAEVRRKQ